MIFDENKALLMNELVKQLAVITPVDQWTKIDLECWIKPHAEGGYSITELELKYNDQIMYMIRHGEPYPVPKKRNWGWLIFCAGVITGSLAVYILARTI